MTNEASADAIILATGHIVAQLAKQYSESQVLTLIGSVRKALSDPIEEPAPEPEALVPAVPIKKSVFPDRIISLETGEAFKSMKRHLSNLGMTPEEYRAKWGLPKDYPIVAAEYSERRSQLAKANGLGRKR